MKLLTTLLLVIASQLYGASDEHAATGVFRIHGRLSLANGNPGFRIWIVGTKRVLGVAESPLEEPMMPPALRDLLRDQILVFGDFTVVPLAKDEPGVMRPVRILRAEHLVITDGTLRVIRKIDGPIAESVSTRLR